MEISCSEIAVITSGQGFSEVSMGWLSNRISTFSKVLTYEITVITSGQGFSEVSTGWLSNRISTFSKVPVIIIVTLMMLT